MQCPSTPVNHIGQLPPQTGENTFGCMVNGEAWVTRTSVDTDAFCQQGLLFISAGIQGNGKHQSIGIFIHDAQLTTKTYGLTTSVAATARFSEFSPQSCLLFQR